MKLQVQPRDSWVVAHGEVVYLYLSAEEGLRGLDQEKDMP